MNNKFKDLFISYGRRESLGFVGRLHQQLKLAGYDGWFDKVDIPDGEKYDKRINHGIEAAHNFVYVMAPRCMTSPYCLLELEYARILGKRVIPIDQMQLFKTESANLSDGDKQILVKFYQDNNIELNKDIQTTQDVLDRSNFLIDTTDWLAAKEEVSDEDCQHLLDWAKKYENHWAKHDDLDYLKSVELPVFGENIDTLESVVERITAVLDRQTDYVHHHTEILVEALLWQKNKKTTKYLLVGEVRLAAEKWLSTEFKAPEQPPCQPIPLICEFICESRKNAENHLTDIFICGDASDICNSVVQSLSRYGKTCWLREQDMQQDVRPEYVIEQGIEGADNFLLFSNNSYQHEITHALNYNKRIILVGQNTEIPDQFKDLPCFNFNQEHDIHELLKLLAHEQDYYHQHKLLLVRSRKWAAENRKSTFLLQGHRLELAKVWLDTHEKRSQNSPLPLHHELITASDNATHQIGTELFVSYSRKDNDFVQKLNTRLQEAGRTVWFDQESQQSDADEEVDFKPEAFKGIDNADNFVFVVSLPSVDSPYCQAELEHATQQGKRVILLLYRQVELELPDALRLDCTGDFETVFLELIQSLEQQKYYVHQQTEILAQAQYWQQNQNLTQHLLVGQERTAAEDWLLTEFLPPAQAPCQPTPLICEFICEARKNAENLMTDIFICYDVEHDKEIRDEVIQSLSYYAKTCWTHDRDIKKGEKYARAIECGIEGADNFFFFISPSSVVSDYCLRELAHALKYHKRIVPLLIKPTPVSDMPDGLRSLQYIDLSNNPVNEILNILKQEQDYYKQHKVLLVRALKWKEENQKSSFLLRGHNQDNAKTWLRLHDKRKEHLPLELHHELIKASEAAKGQLGTEVFISYSRKDGDFARHLNTELQEQGKTTWFDQESISSGVDFEKEIYKGIDGADNFVFVISPDAVDSEYCEREVDYASEQNKRFISILHRETDPSVMPEALRRINWIDFKDAEFEKSFPELIQAIELDREHAHKHTVLQQRAGDWAENNKSGDFLLNITACDNAERWRDVAVEEEKQPAPTELQDGFIDKSRKAIQKANQRKNILFSFVGLLAILAAIAAGFAFVKMGEAKEQAQIALIEKLGAQSIVATESPSASNGYFEHALLLAAQAFNEKDIVTSKSNLLRVLQAKKHKKAYLYGHSGGVTSIVISPDGNLLASGSIDNTVRLWDVKKQKPLGKPLTGHYSDVRSVSFSPDGKTLASAGDDNTVRLWDVETHKSLGKPLTGHSSDVRSVSFSPDGKTLASASYDKTVRLWDVETHKSLGEPLTGHSDGVMSVSFSPDGKILASASEDKTVRLWDVKTHKLLGEPFTGYFSSVDSVSFSPDGKTLASASYDTVYLWDVKTHKSLDEHLTGHSEVINSVSFSPDGKILASASEDNTVRLWDVETYISEPLTGHYDAVYSVSFSQDGKTIASGSLDKTVRLWDVKKSLGKPLIEHFSSVESVSFSPSVESVSFSPDGKTLASGSWDKTVCLWDVKTHKLLGEPFIGHTSIVNSVSFSPDGKILASASEDKTVRLWDVKTYKLLGEPLTGHSSDVRSVSFSSDGKILASASSDDTVRLWDVKTHKSLGEPLAGHSFVVNSVSFSPDGKILASASSDDTVRLWDVKTHKSLGEPLAGHSFVVNSVSFSPDGKTIASGSWDKTVRLWDVKTHKLLGEPLTGHFSWVQSVNFSPDGKTLASASFDKTVRLWDVKTHKSLGEPLTGHSSDVRSVSFSPDGKTLASAGDETLRLWDVNPNSWKQQICTIANRNLSHTEWRKYMGDRPHEKTCPDLPIDTLGAIELVSEGEALIEEGKMKEAIDKFKQALEWDANIVYLDPETKAKQFFAKGLVEQGEELASEGKIEEAIGKFKEAQVQDSNLTFKPKIKAKQLFTKGLVEQGEELASEGKIEKAIGKFKEAQVQDSNLIFEPEAKAKQVFASKLVEQGGELASEGEITETISKYQQAQQVDSDVKIYAWQWNTLCWNGSLYGHATKVIEYCEKAVELEPYSSRYKSRGLARALTDNIQGAIEDFKFVVKNSTDEELIEQAQGRIDSLQKGENPFTEEVLEGLR
ncbi:TIR domain-containing protein [Candidatus Halobeggiatoa sp. HSG11]|nr:TIR domain-containing protein [Candidatus Halobeggiatoa sp. HSG11]